MKQRHTIQMFYEPTQAKVLAYARASWHTASAGVLIVDDSWPDDYN